MLGRASTIYSPKADSRGGVASSKSGISSDGVFSYSQARFMIVPELFECSVVHRKSLAKTHTIRERTCALCKVRFLSIAY